MKDLYLGRLVALAGLFALPLLTGCSRNTNAAVKIAYGIDQRALEAAVGRHVTVEGRAQNRKAGAAIDVGTAGIYVADWSKWPRDLDETTVNVAGKLRATTIVPENVDERGVPTDAGVFGRVFILHEPMLMRAPTTSASATTSDAVDPKNRFKPTKRFVYTAFLRDGQVFLSLNERPDAVVGPFVRKSRDRYSCESDGKGVHMLVRIRSEWVYYWSYVQMWGQPVDGRLLETD